MGDPLTPEVRAVLPEIMHAATTAETCERLPIKASTLFQKTGAWTRQALAAWGWR